MDPDPGTEAFRIPAGVGDVVPMGQDDVADTAEGGDGLDERDAPKESSEQ